jgi:Uma2 family endonuclease
VTLAAPPLAPSASEQEAAPLLLPPDLRLTPEQFELVCDANPEAVLELAADGHLIAMTPTGGETSSRNSRLLIQLGMALPNCDASLVLEERWQVLAPEQRRRFPPLCPDLVVELASPSDEGPRGITALRWKMAAYQRNGARFGWLLIPQHWAVD